MKSEPFIPQYMRSLIPGNRFYGTLKRVGNDWLIEAEPQVMQKLRSLFEATTRDSAGKARIPATKRNTADLNWFMMRFPLEIQNQKKYDASMKECCDKFQRSFVVNTGTVREAASLDFKGTLLTFQESGLAFLLTNERCLLADEMGLGKTVIALAALSKIKKYPVLLIVPPHLMEQWKSEIAKFLGDNVTTHFIQGLKPYQLPEADIYIIHYLIFRGWAEVMKQFDWQTVIMDECQELRHPNSLKYRGIQAMVKETNPPYVFGLSGTPIYNYGNEIFYVMDAIDQHCMGDERYFVKEWCNYGASVLKPELLGASMQEDGLMLRRRKEEVLSELPEKARAWQRVGFDEAIHIKYQDEALAVAKQIPIADDEEKGKLLKLIANKMRMGCGVAKTQHVAEFVKIILDAGEPCILFAYHHLVMDLYGKYLKDYKPKYVTGRETRAEKKENVRAFMDGETNILILNIRTTAGLNLQRARCVVFGELDWSPAVHMQAEDRIHRIGQKKSVAAYYMVSGAPFDQFIIELLVNKELQFDGIMRDPAETQQVVEEKTIKAQNFMWALAQRVFTDGVPEEAIPIKEIACPKCASPMHDGGLFCWSCGFNPRNADKKHKEKEAILPTRLTREAA